MRGKTQVKRQRFIQGPLIPKRVYKERPWDLSGHLTSSVAWWLIAAAWFESCKWMIGETAAKASICQG